MASAPPAGFHAAGDAAIFEADSHCHYCLQENGYGCAAWCPGWETGNAFCMEQGYPPCVMCGIEVPIAFTIGVGRTEVGWFHRLCRESSFVCDAESVRVKRKTKKTK